MHVMAPYVDLSVASGSQIETSLCRQLAKLRLARNITQRELAEAAGLSIRTVKRLEAGKGVSLDTFLRVLIGLGIQGNLAALVPDPGVRPVERLQLEGRERRRARPSRRKSQPREWTWGVQNDSDE